ncbi:MULTISPECIES: hypothetical protein [Halobacteriales]|uniref:DUF3054 domain-containing protein n=1 Tax=Halorubrum laminariae TaxID=1433523 RepID=A0ABD6C4J8_9EURY|nr:MULTISPECIES: hypothetical protein [Halobacteria]MDL0144726.1 hypothetical protein [Halobacterium salinarum]
MSVIPTEWSEPDSRPGVYFDVLLMGLLVVGIGAIAYWEPGSITLSITPQRLAGAIIPGVVLGVAMTYFYIVSERFQGLYADSHITWFVGNLLLAIGISLGLAVAPTWTLLTILATLLTFIVLRVAIYIRTR